MLRAGFVPPLGTGFQRFVAGETGQKALTAARAHEAPADVLDTHPPLRERLQALEGLPPGRPATDDPLAVTLLADVERLEPELIAALMPPEAGRLALISWTEVGERVYQPLWRAEAEQAAAHASALPVGRLGEQAGTLSATLGLKLLPNGDAVPNDVRLRRGNFALGAALAVALARAGWTTEAPPGDPVLLEGPRGSLDPFAVVEALVQGDLASVAWARQCEELGMAGLEMLGASAPASTPTENEVPA